MDSRDAMRGMILGLVLMVFLGHIFMWIMIPNKFYREKWLPKLRADTSSTYFGVEGTNVLIFTFPVLFIAVLGSLYLHLGKRNGSNNIERRKKHTRIAIWRRPMIVKGLGIVTKTELAFFVMFLALLIWSFYTYLRVGFARISHSPAAKNGEKMWEEKLDTAAFRLGLVGNIVLAFLFYPVTRGSSVLPLLGLTSEASVKYHIWLGHIVMTLFTAHGVCFIIYWACTHQLSEMVKWSKSDISNVAGELALLFGLVLWTTTLPQIRRKMFELFFYTHHLYILFVVFFVFHVGIPYACMMLPCFYLFMVDRFLRFLQSRNGARLVSGRVLPCETLELNFSKTQGLSYNPTSTLFINVPAISKQQWHPFTITSSSSLEPENLSIVVKGGGNWTKKLYEMVSLPSSVAHLDVSVEGPYGPASTDFLRHEKLVMVSGGSGITPFISIIRELIFMNQSLKLKTPKVNLITAFRSSTDLAMLELLIPISTSGSPISSLDLKIEAYVTRENEPQDQNRSAISSIQTKRFKPNPRDQPITPILGPNSWLWLGLIISSSFVMFLLFMGILTRYYTYPIDHNTNENYPLSAKSALHMLLICLSIAITASSGFYWNKRSNQREVNQVKDSKGATTTTSSGSLYHNEDRELESLPMESIVQTTTVHYGERPNLKKILFELKESSVGVLVSGPKKLRHEVANICSSGSADNLHFDSISFSW